MESTPVILQLAYLIWGQAFKISAGTIFFIFNVSKLTQILHENPFLMNPHNIISIFFLGDKRGD